MRKHIVLISPHREMIDCASLHHLDITVIDSVAKIKNYEDISLDSLFLFASLDFEVLNGIINSIHNINKIDAIVTLTEKALTLAARLSAASGLPTLPWNVIELIHNKSKMRSFLANYDEYALRSIQPANIDEINDFAEKTGFPVIVKPVDGYGSQGVVKLNSIADVKKLNFRQNLIVEEFIPGDEFSVEAFSFSAQHKIMAITRKSIIESDKHDNFTEIGHCLPASLNKTVEQRIIKYVSDFLTITGLNNGPSHTEIKVCGEKIKIIETHNRIGGDRIASLVKLTTGINLVELAILWPLGLCQPVTKEITWHSAAAIRFFNPPCGKLIAVEGIDTLKYTPYVVDIEVSCAVGDTIMPITDSSNRYGFVMVTGNNAAQATANAVNAASAIRFTTA